MVSRPFLATNWSNKVKLKSPAPQGPKTAGLGFFALVEGNRLQSLFLSQDTGVQDRRATAMLEPHSNVDVKTATCIRELRGVEQTAHTGYSTRWGAHNVTGAPQLSDRLL